MYQEIKHEDLLSELLCCIHLLVSNPIVFSVPIPSEGTVLHTELKADRQLHKGLLVFQIHNGVVG